MALADAYHDIRVVVIHELDHLGESLCGHDERKLFAAVFNILISYRKAHSVNGNETNMIFLNLKFDAGVDYLAVFNCDGENSFSHHIFKDALIESYSVSAGDRGKLGIFFSRNAYQSGLKFAARDRGNLP